MYIYGGESDKGIIGEVLKYSIIDNKWEMLENHKVLAYMAYTCDQGVMYTFGGVNSLQKYNNELWSFKNEIWQLLSSNTPLKARQGASMT